MWRSRETKARCYRAWIRFGGLWLLLGLAVLGCRKSTVTSDQHGVGPPKGPDDTGNSAAPSTVFEPRWSVSEIVGSAKCAECHPAIADRYQASHSMSATIFEVGQEPIIEDYDRHEFNTPGNRTYRVERNADGTFHHEIMFDLEGQPIYDQRERIAYVLGSGRRGRSYIIDRDGLFFLSPIAWYSQSRRWALAPGYQPANHARFDRRVGFECTFCHAGRMRLNAAPTDRFARHAIAEGGIGCERCHGPGARHVASQETNRSPSPDPTIVNPARLSATERDSVCYQCHVRSDYVFVQPGHHFSDFLPGDRYAEHWAVFVPADVDGEVPEAELVTQFRSSTCFQKSAGKLGCTSCHDPHGRPSAEELTGYYRDRCLQCHHEHGCSLPEPQRLAASDEDSCIACHMPRLPTRGVPHTALTDHRIRKDPKGAASNGEARTVAPANEPAPSGPLQLQLFLEAEMPRPLADRARGMLLADLAAQRSDRQLAVAALQQFRLNPSQRDQVLEILGDDVEVLKRVGVLFALLRQSELATRVWRRALELHPSDPQVLYSWGVARLGLGDASGGLELFDRLVDTNPYLAEYQWLRANALEKLGRREDAIRSAERTIELDPTALFVREWLVQAYTDAGRADDAERQRSFIKRMTAR